jgi:Tol biopolymer transport system component
MARNVSQQAETLGQEHNASYTEPLWRRVADGPLTPTRRVTGGSEPEGAACAASGEAELPRPEQASVSDPCQGPFAVESTFGVWSGSRANVVPQLSADGYTVAFLATAPRVTLGVDFGRGAETEESDLYLADMHPGLSRVQALTPLTELASGKVGFEPGNAPVVDVGVSPDGKQIAFSTRRTEFPLGSPAYVSTTAAVAGMAELFDVDLAGNTLTRVTNGYEGGPAEHPHKVLKATEEPYEVVDGAQSPSFSADGNLLVFSATASNLVYGDGNTPPVGVESRGGSADGSDVFDITRKLFPAVSAQGYVSPGPPNPAVEPEWRVGVTAVSMPDGSVKLYVQTPGAGTATASASSAVPAPAAHAGRRKGKKATRSAAKAATVVLRTVASAHASAGSSALLTVQLTLARSYQPLATRTGGLDGTVRVLFTAPGHAAVYETVAVTFAGHAALAKRAKHKTRRTAHR